MKYLHASWNEDANKSIEQALQKTAMKENLNFCIDLATIAMVTKDTKPMEDEPQTFNAAKKISWYQVTKKMARGYQKEFNDKKKQQAGRKTLKSQL